MMRKKIPMRRTIVLVKMNSKKMQMLLLMQMTLRRRLIRICLRLLSPKTKLLRPKNRRTLTTQRMNMTATMMKKVATFGARKALIGNSITKRIRKRISPENPQCQNA